MDVRGISGFSSTQSISPAALSPAASSGAAERRSGATAPSALNPKDVVEISAANSEKTAAPSLREMRLAQIKSQIEAGTYDTPERFEVALRRMFESIAS